MTSGGQRRAEEDIVMPLDSPFICIIALSVKMRHHLVFAHWLEIVKVNSLLAKLLASMRWNQCMILFRGYREFCSQLSRLLLQKIDSQELTMM